jgi:hypothetical protein
MKNINMNNLTRTETYTFEHLEPTKLAWLAGLYQGEAYFYADKRVRSKSKIDTYVSPPPIPIVKLEMIQKDLIEHVAQLLDEKVIEVNRKTSAENKVYKVVIQQRKKTELFLRAILPYVIGQKTRSEITQLLEYCDLYNEWISMGGKNQQAHLAAFFRLKNKAKLSKTSDDI